MRRPPFYQGTTYDPSSEIGPKSPIAIAVPTREARTCLLIRPLLIRELAVPPVGYIEEEKSLHPQYANVLSLNGRYSQADGTFV
ncbi:hypothetical protein AVEN_125351-1 [Araneus ventricosus]|uniref:Uncharacterized protein n=1 Tax=Araneus ventricosus TaxID=182803 RepID=A0A4Y2SGB1_ARAVE|nr:hypothetical protein AVEN_125351-1 [Araneus ventricosus]